MSISATIAIILAAASPAAPSLCNDIGNKIEPDMRILESDLTQSAAIQAADKLRNMVKRGQLTDEFQFGALNQSKIVYGHILLKQAQSDANSTVLTHQRRENPRHPFANGLAVKASGTTDSSRPAPNNSFKPSPLRGLGRASYDHCSAVAATLPGLTQVLGRTHDFFNSRNAACIHWE